MMPFRVHVLALGAFALIATELGVIGILPQLSKAFDVTMGQAGWLLSGFALAVAIAGPGMTLLFSRVDRKLSLCLVLAVFLVANLACAASQNFGWLLLFRIVPALVHPVFWSMAMTVGAGSVPADRSHRAVATIFTGMSAGIVLGIPLASWLAGQLGWRTAFLAFAALNGMALIAHLAVIPRLSVEAPLALGSQLRILRKQRLWWSLVTQIGLTAAAFATYGYIAGYLRDALQMTPQMTTALLLVFGVAGVFGTIVAGRMIGRNIDRTVLLFGALLVPVWLLLFLFGHDPWIGIALVICWGLVHAATVPLCQALVLRAAPEAPEFANSLFNSFGNVGITCGTSVGGIVIAKFGIASLPLCGIALLLTALFLFGTAELRTRWRAPAF